MSDPSKTISGVLVAFSAGLGWTGSKTNKKKTKEICDDANASEDSGKWSDALFPPSACGKKNSYTALKKHLGQMRSFTRDRSYVFEDSIWRVLPEKAVPGYKQIVETEGKPTAYELLETFIQDLPILKTQAALPKPNGRGDGYKEEDYPSEGEIRDLFHYSVDYRPVPTSSGLNPVLYAEAVEKLNDLHARRLAEANVTLIKRFLDPLQQLSEQLKDPNKKKIKTVLESIMEISALVPTLDLGGNTQLIELANDVSASFAGITPDLLRENEEMQKLVGQTCSKFTAALGSFGQVGKRAFA